MISQRNFSVPSPCNYWITRIPDSQWTSVSTNWKEKQTLFDIDQNVRIDSSYKILRNKQKNSICISFICKPLHKTHHNIIYYTLYILYYIRHWILGNRFTLFFFLFRCRRIFGVKTTTTLRLGITNAAACI